MNNTTARLLAAIKPRAGPLIITVFGDTIAPYGGAVWLSSLIAMMENFGLSERLVRTGVYRLAREGWLKGISRGRKSYYILTRDGAASFAAADARIYNARPRQWSGQWQIVHILPGLTASRQQSLRKALEWQGFGMLSRSCYIRPAGKPVDIASRISPWTAIFTGKLASGSEQQAIAATAWDLDRLAQDYEQFIKLFSRPAGHLPQNGTDAFALRTCLVHQYRRILLKDPQLPQNALPAGWPGDQARALAGDIYRQVTPRADAYIAATLKNPRSTRLKPVPGYYARFQIEDATG